MTIRYIPYKQIDQQKWDACIASALNGSVYVYSHYLDSLSPGWDALVMDDYDAVMPLCWKRKWGIRYLIQPYLSAEGGVYSSSVVDSNLLRSFLSSIPSRFKFWEFSLNPGNPRSVPGFSLSRRTNYVLPLNVSYAELLSGYRRDLKANLRRAVDAGLRYVADVPVSTVLELADAQLSSRTSLSSLHYVRFAELFHSLSSSTSSFVPAVSITSSLVIESSCPLPSSTSPLATGITRAVVDGSGRVLASAVFLFSHKKAYYVVAGNTPEGRAVGASHMLLDQFICEFSSSDLIFDFEGSDIPSLALFYKAFGAREVYYPFIRENRLPWPVSLLKR